MTQELTFGRYFSQLRKERGYTLRDFCLKFRFDAEYVSKVERGVLPSPEHSEVESFISALEIPIESPERETLVSLAETAKETAIGVNEEALLNKLPIIFRTVDNKELNKDKLNEVIRVVKNTLQ